MAAFATSVQKISPIWWKNRPHSPKNTIKKRVKILKKPRPPASENLLECDANQVFFFIWP
jgi:hypothetical protein